MMSEGDLTDKQEWLLSRGFYGHWWPFHPYNSEEYQGRLRRCLHKYYKQFICIDHLKVGC